MVIAKTFAIFLVAVIAELGGAYAIWRWRRDAGSAWLIGAGIGALFLYALVQTFQPVVRSPLCGLCRGLPPWRHDVGLDYRWSAARYCRPSRWGHRPSRYHNHPLGPQPHPVEAKTFHGLDDPAGTHNCRYVRLLRGPTEEELARQKDSGPDQIRNQRDAASTPRIGFPSLDQDYKKQNPDHPQDDHRPHRSE